jgi:glycerol kinase
MAVNNWLMQFIADLLGQKLSRPACTETTALGAAFLAGLQRGIYSSLEEISELWQLNREFLPNMTVEKRNALYQGWKDAINQAI